MIFVRTNRPDVHELFYQNCDSPTVDTLGLGMSTDIVNDAAERVASQFEFQTTLSKLLTPA